jgi:hypothetical protein
MGRRSLGDAVPVLAAGEPERVADQVQHTGLGHRQRPRRPDRVRKALEPVAHDDADVVDAPVLDLGEHAEPELGALAAVPGPQPQDVPFTLDGDRDRGVDGPIGDLAIADLHMDRIDEHRRVDRVEGPGLPIGHLGENPVGDVGDRVTRHLRAVDLREMRRDFPGSETLGGEGQHQVVDTIQAALALAHDLGIEGPVPVTRHVEHDRAHLGHHRL